MQSTDVPLISVLMLTYNHAPYIKEAIESVLGQKTEYSFELIICDDASTDGTQNIARQYESDPRVVLSLQPTNTKFSKNFVDGTNLIRGKYVAFCEGDDYWSSPHKLQKQVSFLEANPDFSVCAHKVEVLFMGAPQQTSGTQYIYKDCQSDEQRIKDGVFYADEAIANYYFQTGSLILRWRFSQGLPHWFRKRMMFDHFMFMLHAVEGKIKYFDEVMSIWRRHGGGYTWLQTQDKGLFFQKEGEDWIAMYKKMDEFFSGRFTWQINERIFLALRSIVQNCMETGNTEYLQILIKTYEPYFDLILKDAVLLDALRLANPERPEFVPPWESTPLDEERDEESLSLPHVESGDNAEAPDAFLSGGEAESTAAMPTNFAVGGYMELGLDDIPHCPESVWDIWTGDQEYARFFNLRSALMRWIWQNGVSTIWLPAYAPTILESNHLQCQVTRKLYGVGERLEPSAQFLDAVQPGEAVLTINYLGKPPPKSFCDALAARPDILWIEDRAQCLTNDATQAHAVIYSPRKILGVPDGGLLVGKGAQTLEDWCFPPSLTVQAERQNLLMERYERPERMSNALNLRYHKHDMEHQLSRRRMSRTTEALLRRLPMYDIARRRQDNWETLYSALGPLCLWDLPRPDFAPYAFPLLAPLEYPTAILHTLLARQNILCQRMLSPLNLPKNLYPLEQSLAKRLLLLPCDQRYTKDDMQRIAILVENILHKPGYFTSTGGSFGVAN